MSDLKERVAAMMDREQSLIEEYEEIVRTAAGDTERRLAESMVKAQRFQLSTLRLIVEDKVPDRFHCFGAVTHEEVKVRSGPSAQRERIRVVDRGVPVIVKEIQGNWAHVQLPDGAAGWVFRDYVRCDLTG